MRNFVIINGVNSNTINGLGINELPPVTKPEMRNIREEIDGRDGDIITDLGYSAYDKTITIGLFGTGYDINDIVAFFNGEGTIVFSNEPDKYYNFKILNQIDYESLQKFKTASITFHCQPFKYPLSETPLEIEYDYIEDEGETLTLNNTGNALMKLDLKGNTSQSGTPTPTSPIPVSVVSGDNDVVVCGKNLANCNGMVNTTNNGITFTINRNTNNEVSSITINGTATNYNALCVGTPYRLSAGTYNLYGNGITDNIILQVLNETLTTQLGYVGKNDRQLTLNADTNIVLRIMVNANATISNVDYKPMIATTSGLSYEPYQSQTYEVDLPVENLLPNNAASGSSNGITWEVQEDGGINVSGTSTAQVVIPYTTGTTFTLQAGTYYLNASNITTANTFLQVWYSTATLLKQVGLTGATITIAQDTTYTNFRSQIVIPSGTTINTTIYSQLEKGSKANHYTEYGTTPIELCKIGTYQDYIYKDNGKWYLHKEIGKVVLNGSENWQYDSTYKYFRDNTYDFGTQIPKGGVDYDQYSNNFKIEKTWTTFRDSTTTSMGYQLQNSGYKLAFRNTSYTTVADFKTWLGTHNTNVYYVLATPYLSLIEDNNLIEQLDNLENAMSYEGTTNISQVNNDKAFIISAKAIEDGTNEVVVNNIGNVYSKPLLALEGSGNVDIYLDNTQILKANVEDKMNIDIAQLEAYNPDTMTLLNRQVIGNYNSMTLQPGNNTIRIDGSLDKATISNYTRWL